MNIENPLVALALARERMSAATEAVAGQAGLPVDLPPTLLERVRKGVTNGLALAQGDAPKPETTQAEVEQSAPSDEQLLQSLRLAIKGVDLRELSFKQLRKGLEAEFGVVCATAPTPRPHARHARFRACDRLTPCGCTRTTHRA